MATTSLARWATAILSCAVLWTARIPGAPCAEPAPRADGAPLPHVPDWVYPLNASDSGGFHPPDDIALLHVPGSPLAFTAAQLSNRFSAPGWFPGQHSTMPTIVAVGHRPDVFACGYCHTPAGQGRPENASLAGLPAAALRDLKVSPTL